MNELSFYEVDVVSGGLMALWAKLMIEGLSTAGGAFVGIAGGPVGIGVGATLGAMAGQAIIHAAGG